MALSSTLRSDEWTAMASLKCSILAPDTVSTKLDGPRVTRQLTLIVQEVQAVEPRNYGEAQNASRCLGEALLALSKGAKVDVFCGAHI